MDGLPCCYTSRMVEITPTIHLDEQEIEFVFIRSSGPGGQNVNKLATTAQLRFNVADSTSLPPEVKQRLAKLAGRRMTSAGVLIIEARQYRSQERNRQAALRRLIRLVKHAAEPPRPRHKTRPTQSSILHRLETKRKRSEIKRIRRGTDIEG